MRIGASDSRAPLWAGAVLECRCLACDVQQEARVAPGAQMPPPPVGWGVVTDYDGRPVGLVCSRECYSTETSRPIAPAQDLDGEIADVIKVLDQYAFDSRQPGEPVAVWLGRTMEALRT